MDQVLSCFVVPRSSRQTLQISAANTDVAWVEFAHYVKHAWETGCRLWVFRIEELALITLGGLRVLASRFVKKVSPVVCSLDVPALQLVPC